MFSRRLLVLVVVSFSLFSKTVYWLGQDWNFAPNVDLNKPSNIYDKWEAMISYFRELGLDLKFISGKQISKNQLKYKQIFASTNTSYVLLENIHENRGFMSIYFKAVPYKKRALIAWEPPTVLPEMYSEQLLSKFAKVLTWDNYLVDNVKFIKFYHYNFRPMISDTVPFDKKKFACMIFSNKSFSHPLELYSLRRRIIRAFSRSALQFDLYGFGWPSNTPNYKGCVGDKALTIKNYKFCFAMENTRNLSGYLTEKIWDVFAAGSIPIYWGDSNIENEIPSDCYIDFTKFSRFSEIVKFLQEMSQEEYERRIQCIKEFLASDAVKNYKYDAYAQSVLFALSS